MTEASAVVRRFWPYTRGDRRKLVLGGLAMLVVSGCELGTVVLFGAITDRVLAARHLAGFWPLAGCWLAVVAVAAVAMFFAEYLTSLASERFALRLRDDLVAHAQRLSPDFFDTRNPGDLMVRLTGDVAVLEGVASSGVLGVVTSAVSAALFIGAAFVVSWQLALEAGAVAPVFWLASRGFSGPIARAAERERALTGRLTSAIEETLSSQALIQAFNRQTAAFTRLHDEGDSWLRARMAQIRLGAIYAPAVYLVETVCVLAVFGFGAWELTRGAITLGGLLAFAILLAYLYPPLQGLAGYRLSVSAAAESISRITEILDARPAVADGTAVRAAIGGRGLVSSRRACSSPGRSPTTSATASAGPPRPRSWPRPGWRAPTSSSAPCLRAMKRRSASAAACCRAGSGSTSPSPARSCATHPSWCSTSRPPGSARPTPEPCCTFSGRSWRGAPPSSSRTTRRSRHWPTRS
jgi:ATP-binding cassette subfamily B protein